MVYSSDFIELRGGIVEIYNGLNYQGEYKTSFLPFTLFVKTQNYSCSMRWINVSQNFVKVKGDNYSIPQSYTSKLQNFR